jgi:hypothetical protein
VGWFENESGFEGSLLAAFFAGALFFDAAIIYDVVESYLIMQTNKFCAKKTQKKRDTIPLLKIQFVDATTY